MDVYQILKSNDLIWSVQEAFVVFFILVAVSVISGCLWKKGRIKKSQAAAAVILVFFLLLVVTTTVFGRNPGNRRYELRLFWSYGEIFSGNTSILEEVLLNYILLLPGGVLLPIMCGKVFHWYHGLIFGFLISSGIETLQLITCRGLFEFDDIIHNSIGCMAGCVLCSMILKNLKR